MMDIKLSVNKTGRGAPLCLEKQQQQQHCIKFYENGMKLYCLMKCLEVQTYSRFCKVCKDENVILNWKLSKNLF